VECVQHHSDNCTRIQHFQRDEARAIRNLLVQRVLSDSFGGTQDNGTQKYSGMLTWEDVVFGDGGWTAIDPATPSNVYASCYAGNGLIWKSTADGVSGSWRYAANGINADWASEFLPPLAIDHLHPTNLYLGTYRVYQTTNSASNWSLAAWEIRSPLLRCPRRTRIRCT
jgi:hypothetical protein